MVFTLKDVFNDRTLGLTGRHYAVIAHLPDDLGAGVRVVDVVSAADMDECHCSKKDLLDGFRKATRLMPYQRHANGGGVIQFLAENPDGTLRPHPTMTIPGKSKTGATFTDAWADWLCWRARTDLWLDRKRVVLTTQQQENLLTPSFSVIPAACPP